MKKALAIKYLDEWPAPIITAKAEGALVQRFLRVAEENNIVIEKNKDLSDVLFQFPQGSFIPESSFEIMADLLSFVYQVKRSEDENFND